MNQHIVLISGSNSSNSHTIALLKYIGMLLEVRGLKTTIWDLEKKPLPFLDPIYHEDLNQPNKVVKEYLELIKSADGVIIGTPIYHGSFSGVVKNGLDHLDSDIFKLKPVGVVSNGGSSGNTQACEQLRSIIRTLYGYALQTQITTGEDDYSKNRKIVNVSIKKRCERLADEMKFFLEMINGISKHQSK